MRKLTVIVAVVVFVGATSSTASAVDWNHDPTNAIGPENWGELDPSFRTCGAILTPPGSFVATGLKQSPVDIITANATVTRLKRLMFRYRPMPLEIENKGHVIEVAVPAAEAGVSQLRILGHLPYNLLQFHFHAPSEHTINGTPAAMEVHFVHQNAVGEIAVVGVLMNAVPTGGNPVVDEIFSYAPTSSSSAGFGAGAANGARVEVPGVEVDPLEVLPELALRGSYYTYSGSLTTPPCTEGVRWFVLKEPITVTQATVDAYHSIIAMFPGYTSNINNRPVQPLSPDPMHPRPLLVRE
jgi:carbonic anhydrase